MSEPTPAPSMNKEVAVDADSPATWRFPNRRPPRALQLFIQHLWLLATPVYFGLFLAVVCASNSLDLSSLPSPRALQGLTAVALLVSVGAGPYFLFRHQIEWTRHDLLLHREAKAALQQGRRCQRKSTASASDATCTATQQACAQLAQALREGPPSRVYASLDELGFAMGTALLVGKKGAIREYLESIGVAILIALSFRAFFIEAYRIPSGAMIPTLQVGDQILVNKFLYGVRIPWTRVKLFKHAREPRRGEVVLLADPQNPRKEFIKRVVAVAGDSVEVCGGKVLINKQRLRRQALSGTCEYHEYDEDHPTGFLHQVQCFAYLEWNEQESYITVHSQQGDNPSQRCDPATIVPPEHVFVMGDSRDDGRFSGLAHYDLLKGKAWLIWWSAGEKTSVRLNRMFQRIHRG